MVRLRCGIWIIDHTTGKLNMFKMLENITKAAVGVATLPVDIVADTVTLGGTLNDKQETYTGKKLDNVMTSLEKACDPEE